MNGRTLKRVQIGALLLMVAIGLETLRYLYTSLDRALKFSFLKPDRWNTHHLVDPGTIVEIGARAGYFAVWITVILLSVLAFLSGLQVLNNVRRGRIFDAKTAHLVTRLGLVLSLAMVADLIFHAIDPWLLTRGNAEPLPIQWGYDPSDLKTLSMAIILFLFGWVMHESIAIDRENSEFV